ncbi:hypothetical protein EMPG_11116 [Blastomyces silverae]|uniref:Dihydroceramidase n=1 Tax=Blastomyces silverae TaxID=2060906 RepID=A0A0H1B2W2_9EURO|nr:hypothetical protein EMPG_11116 [Blastomyces silverae]
MSAFSNLLSPDDIKTSRNALSCPLTWMMMIMMMLVFLGGYAIYRQLRRKGKVEASHALSYMSLIVVGIGSAVYHATLKYPLQLVDDLSMLLGAGIMFHHVVTINSGSRMKVTIFVALTVALTTAAWAHIRLGDSALHQVVFGTMVVTVGYRSVKLLARLIPDKRMRLKLRRLLRMGNLTLFAAYGLWLVDVFACPSLRSVRHAIGLPLAWLFELHGWWHILTAIGVYIAMIVGEFLHDGNRTQVLGPEDGYLKILRGPSLQEKGKEKENGIRP